MQLVLALLLAVVGIHISVLLQEAVPSTLRAGVASGVSTCQHVSWIGFLPFSLVFGWATQEYGLHTSGWMITAATVLMGALLIRQSLRHSVGGGDAEVTAAKPTPVTAAC